MKIIGVDKLDEAKTKYPIVRKQIDVWRDLVEEADWETPYNLKTQFGSADLLGNKLVVFNIKGNHFRLLVKIDYQFQLVIIKKFGTHKEYDTWKLK